LDFGLLERMILLAVLRQGTGPINGASHVPTIGHVEVQCGVFADRNRHVAGAASQASAVAEGKRAGRDGRRAAVGVGAREFQGARTGLGKPAGLKALPFLRANPGKTAIPTVSF